MYERMMRNPSLQEGIVGLDDEEQEGIFTPELAVRRTLSKRELEGEFLKEEVSWRQESRVKWIREGDCNSKFFHRVANDRWNGKFIKSLMSEDGIVLNNIESILEEIKCHFGKLFSKPLREKEIHNAVLHLNKEKAPGLDGFTIGFYQQCWETIKEDL
ncbi:hypothetical protein CK203_112489 [Vitis vinifera]|uniref:Reverse transcriptase domain-containing protein n=1 Tax=Vitis vinifera TaxID=29760 RepID=A0A438EB99_VITVI|nr:hypothetical protein CK203_112489 [Vitis vinifera]